MPYVITEACVGTKDKACVDVCPVDCIYEGDQQLYIHPDECIDCGACEPECPVTAIFPEEDVPAAQKQYVQDRILERSADVARLIADANCHIYVCGLKDMEDGVDRAFRDACRKHGLDWDQCLPELRTQGRYHVETY